MAATSSARGLRAIVRSRARDWSHTLTPLHVFGGHPLLDAEIPTSSVTGRPLSPQPMFMGLLAAAIRRTAGDSDAWRNDDNVARWVRDQHTGVQTAKAGSPD